MAVIFFLQKNIRTTTFRYFKTSGVKLSLLNVGNEMFYLIGTVIINFLSLSFNVAYIDTLSNGLQPILAFLMVFLAYKLLPHIYTWEYHKKELVRKLTFCILIFVLLFLFYRMT